MAHHMQLIPASSNVNPETVTCKHSGVVPSMKIFEALREDHDNQRALADQLVKTHGDSSERSTLFDELKAATQNHAKAEERCFYMPLIDCDLTQEKARHSIAEHHEIDELIKQLEETDFSSSGWLGYAERLRETLTHHLDEEEHEIFQLAGKALTEAQKSSLADEYRAMMRAEQKTSQ